MDVVLPQLHALVARRTTGVVWIRDPRGASGAAWARIELVAGWVHAFAPVEPPAAPEQLALAAKLRPPRDPAAAFSALLHAFAVVRGEGAATLLESDEPRVRLGAVAPFHPTRAMRGAAAAALRAERALADELDRRLVAAAGLLLGAPLHASAVDPDEHRAAALLTERARTVAELLDSSRCPPPRLHALLRELALLGALRAEGVDLSLAALREHAEAARARRRVEEAERRRQYHAAARKVHPDLQPEADEDRRADLTAEMAALAAKQRRRDG